MTDTPTRAERDEMRALLAKATPGPWHPGHHTDDSHSCNCQTIVNESYLSGLADIVVGNDRSIEDGGIDGPPADEARANALVITELRNRAEALLDELDRAEATIARLTAEVTEEEVSHAMETLDWEADAEPTRAALTSFLASRKGGQ